MGKTVAFAVAGSGKTESIIRRLSPETRTLVLTYTQNTEEDLRRRVIRRFGYVPEGVRIATYFSFLVTFCQRPLLHSIMNDRGISFDRPSDFANRFPLSSHKRYMDGARRLYHCRLAKLLERECLGELIRRLERYFDAVVIDEVQDFGGYDFDLLMALSSANVDWYMVGDFYQHIFDTSRDGAINKALHADADAYKRCFVAHGFDLDTQTLKGSHRCSVEVCAFIRRVLGVPIEPARLHSSNVVTIKTAGEARELHADPAVLKLFYQEHSRYGCNSLNWGASKGLDHCEDVCVVLNKTAWTGYTKNTLIEAKPTTRNKLYVAVSRPHRHLYVLDEQLLATLKTPKAPSRLLAKT
ncbi:hypothetical protein [Lysobacter sp. HA18]